MSKLTKRVLIGLGGTGVALLATATPAFAAGTFVSPSSNFSWGVDAQGNPTTQDIKTTNFPANTTVYIEVCDGKSPAAQGYDATIDCDPASSPASVLSTGTSFVEDYNPAAVPARAIVPFRGAGLSDVFNCLAPEDVKAGTNPKPDGSVTPIGSTTKNGNQIDTGVPSWDNCQLRVASSTAGNTSDQSYLTASLQNTPPPASTPEVPLAIILPLGAAGLFAGGFLINRRRRSNRVTA